MRRVNEEKKRARLQPHFFFFRPHFVSSAPFSFTSSCRPSLPAPPSRRPPPPACPRPRPPPRRCACESTFYSVPLKRVFERRRGPARAGGGKEVALNQPRRRRWENKSSLSPRSLPLPPSLPLAHQFTSTAGSRLTTSKCRWRKGSDGGSYRSARGRKKKRLESSRAFEAA